MHAHSIMDILTANRHITKTDRSTKGFDVALNGTFIWFMTISKADDRYGNSRELNQFNLSIPLKFFGPQHSNLIDKVNQLTSEQKTVLGYWVRDEGIEFRLSDEDGDIHYRGWYYGDDDDSMFDPLDFARENSGATTMEIRDNQYELKRIGVAKDYSLKRVGVGEWMEL